MSWVGENRLGYRNPLIWREERY